MIKFLIDENFNHRVLRGLTIRFPHLDYIVAQDTDLKGVDDPSLLAWASEHERVLLTHDIQTIPGYAYERVVAGLPMVGVITVPETMPIGTAIEELLTIIECSEQSEYESQVFHLPL
jgi:predicted nuclease of predicted toxin-antitoxin system